MVEDGCEDWKLAFCVVVVVTTCVNLGFLPVEVLVVGQVITPEFFVQPAGTGSATTGKALASINAAKAAATASNVMMRFIYAISLLLPVLVGLS